MILTCPACAVSYEVPEASLGASGRKVRCSKCGHQWHQAPEAAPEPLEEFEAAGFAAAGGVPPEGETVEAARAAAEQDVPPLVAPDQARARASGREPALLPWAIAAMLLLAVLGGAIGFPARVVALWPAAAGLYHSLGLIEEPVGAGLQLQMVHSRKLLEGGAVVVEGEVANVSPQPRPVPRLQARLLGRDHQVLKEWTFVLGQDTLQPGQSSGFVTSQAAEEEVGEVQVSFIEAAP